MQNALGRLVLYEAEDAFVIPDYVTFLHQSILRGGDIIVPKLWAYWQECLFTSRLCIQLFSLDKRRLQQQVV
jgi:hypothetical protein